MAILRDYECPECGHADEEFDSGEVTCEKCDAVMRIISTGCGMINGNFEGVRPRFRPTQREKANHHVDKPHWRDPNAAKYYRNKGHMK